MIARSVQNKSLLKQLHSLSSCVKSPRVHKELPTFCQSRRHLHANWSYLLNNVWLYKNGGKDNNCNRIGRGYVDGIYESDSPSDDLDMPSVLFLHDAFADHQMCFELAKDLVNASSENNISRLQCFLADVR